MNLSATKLNKPADVEVYSQTANIYDPRSGLTETRTRRRAITHTQIRDGEAAPEVAVDPGLTFLATLKGNPDGNKLAIDLTPAMLTESNRKAGHTGQNIYQFNPRWLGRFCGVLPAGYVQKARYANARFDAASQLGFPREILTTWRMA
jgi:hypothetical protein